MGGVDAAGRTARIVLTGPGGGTWDTALGLGETPGEPDATLVLDVVDYCRLAARRLAPDEVRFTAEGDEVLARQMLERCGRLLGLRGWVRCRRHGRRRSAR